MITKKFLPVAVAAIIVATGVITSCRPKFAPPPYIPSGYYECIEVNPPILVGWYWGGYGDIWTPIGLYNDRYYVFKDVLVQEWTIQDLENGWIWLDYVRCELVNPEEMSKYKMGDRIDVVGFNTGPNMDDLRNKMLIFTGCYVLPPGVIQLPSEGNGGIDGIY